jgi:hypothetical protein
MFPCLSNSGSAPWDFGTQHGHLVVLAIVVKVESNGLISWLLKFIALSTLTLTSLGKRRYLILRLGCLYYFANETASSAKGSFVLSGYK